MYKDLYLKYKTKYNLLKAGYMDIPPPPILRRQTQLGTEGHHQGSLWDDIHYIEQKLREEFPNLDLTQEIQDEINVNDQNIHHEPDINPETARLNRLNTIIRNISNNQRRRTNLDPSHAA